MAPQMCGKPTHRVSAGLESVLSVSKVLRVETPQESDRNVFLSFIYHIYALESRKEGERKGKE